MYLHGNSSDSIQLCLFQSNLCAELASDEATECYRSDLCKLLYDMDEAFNPDSVQRYNNDDCDACLCYL
ncbi:hypothetical protein DPMN_083782 [Dreissena polymorpha]|uniref:Uncharacterized protein n=1 Tax=Dreissena polymorpha TaxID=45954 RepID=A0A9D3Y9Y3_DREPO|nr:hypothetical protein DPMN_083782 [Dreissena polymorpha]